MQFLYPFIKEKNVQENIIVVIKMQNNCDNNIGLSSISIAIMEKEQFD